MAIGGTCSTRFFSAVEGQNACSAKHHPLASSAAATLDREHDRADEKAGRRIACPLLVLWSRRGALEQSFADAGGPTGVWRRWAQHVEGHAIDAGHFFPEEAPAATAATLERFFGADQPPSSCPPGVVSPDSV